MKLADLFSLKDKVAIVTGGGRGIGEFIATGLAEAGAHLVIGSRKAAKLAATAEKLREFGVKVLSVPCDMEKESDINQLVALIGSIFVLPTLIMGLIGFIEFIIYLTISDDEFERRYLIERKGWF